ncbi:hypothetical protein NUKP55_02980 [Klebsiella variicola]|nr:hypothetical protein NUKP55_02980 [Klebsiella variicola]
MAGTGSGAPPARSVFPVTLTTGTDPPFPLSLWERAGVRDNEFRSLNPITITALPFSLFLRDG